MKKGILALAVASAVLALPVAAAGDALRGQGPDDFQIRFTLKSRGGEPTAIKNFRFSKLDTPCATGQLIQARGKFPFIKVNDRNRFSDSLRRAGRKARVKGRVSGDLDTVRGTIRVQGRFGPAARNCDSGRERWVAR
jgi:hypothetical protein